jgi:hypothetical protein
VRTNAPHGKGRLIMSSKKPVSPTLTDLDGAVITQIVKSKHKKLKIHVDTRGLAGNNVEVTAYFNILETTKWAETEIWTPGMTEIEFEVGYASYGIHLGTATIFYTTTDGKSDELHVPIVK